VLLCGTREVGGEMCVVIISNDVDMSIEALAVCDVVMQLVTFQAF
jgi:hypothetical protein